MRASEPERMRKIFHRRYVLFACILLLGGAGLWLVRTRKAERGAWSREAGEQRASIPASKPVTDIRAELNDAAAQLAAATNQPEAAQKLADLRTRLAAMPSDAAAGAIREFLQSSVDAPTHLDLRPGPGGLLERASSLRVFLLDYLAQVDPPGAAADAERILSAKTSPDEWAIALRNYARVQGSQEGRAFLRQKFEELVHHETWRENPSAGFLQAFDVAVFAGGTELVPALADLLRRKDNQAVAHAAYLALDRLVLREPVALLAELQQAPELMAGREFTRANYFARADLTDAQQKVIVEAYLLDPRRLPAELETFASVYPNRNLMLSHNLLTTASPLSETSRPTRDRLALGVLEEWLTDARFTKVRPHLQTMKTRLEGFVQR